ncbi:hypothetical protein JW877_10675 [bacterium]|nr:hypothetical protein [bacterium]
MDFSNIVTLQNLNNHVAAEVGFKALSLYKLHRLGFHIAKGFVIPANAYFEHLQEHQLTDLADSARVAQDHFLKGILVELRDAICRATLNNRLKQDISELIRRCKLQRVVVRSSASAEDLPENSFAGLYNSFLDIEGEDECFRAVKMVWASAWNEGAYLYRRRCGFDHHKLGMAVILQEQVKAETGGVIFTADPVLGYRSKMIIEVCQGTPEKVVSGRVNPSRIEISKRNLQILNRPSLNNTDYIALNPKSVRKLSRMARKLEDKLGYPQDIEWAFSGGHLIFLQARPITALPPLKNWEERQVWTNSNSGEILPDVITPLNWSFARGLVRALFGAIFSWIGLDFKDYPMLGLIGGRTYFNMNTFAGGISVFPGMKNTNISELLGGSQLELEESGELIFTDEDIPDVQYHPLKMLVRLPVFSYKFATHSPRQGSRFLLKMELNLDTYRKLELFDLSESQLLAKLNAMISDLYNSVHGIAFGGLGMFYFPKLKQFCQRYLGDQKGEYASRLMTGIGGIESAKAGLDLWALADSLKDDPHLEALLVSGITWVELKTEFAKTARGKEFLVRWKTFMNDHGHHCRGELELYNPRWEETPEYILNILRSYLKSKDEISMSEQLKQKVVGREMLTASCRKRLRNPLKKLQFNFFLNRSQYGCLLRENIKNCAVKYWAMMRKIVLELGCRLEEKGLLKDSDDIFFLYLDELNSVIRGTIELDYQEVIASRRGRYNDNLKLNPPPVVVGKLDAAMWREADDIPIRAQYSGLTVSPGIVSGPARVIGRLDGQQQVLPGEILIVPYYDPGWSPYFINAAGIVVDQGGLLSHASIIAREYGIPTVVNVGPASKTIKTGQKLSLDATNGMLTVLQN